MVGQTNTGGGIKPLYDAIVGLGVTPEKKSVKAITATISEELVSRQKAIDAINSTKQVSNGTKFTQAGMVSVYVKCSVSNHDNSNEDYIGCYITKNGKQVANQRIWVGAFDGGTVTCSKAFTVEAGDTVAFSYYGNSDLCISVSGSGSIVYTPNPF